MQLEQNVKSKKPEKSLEDLELELAEIEIELAKAPKERVPCTNNSTIEKLAMLEANNCNGIGVYQDEIMQLLERIDGNDTNGERQQYMSGFEGGTEMRIHRVSRQCLPVRSHTISIGGTCQPDPIKAYVKRNAGESGKRDGLVQRLTLLFAWVDSIRGKYNDILENIAYKTRIEQIALKLHTWILEIIATEEEYLVSIFTEAAQLEFERAYNNLMDAIHSYDDAPDMQAHLGKYPKLLPAIALIFEVVEQADKGHSCFDGKVGVANLKRAVMITEVLKEHAAWLYGVRGEGKNPSTYELYEKIINGDVKDGDKVRDIYSHGWSHLKNEESVSKAIEELMELGWCCTEAIKGKTKPSIVIRLHPKIRDGKNLKEIMKNCEDVEEGV